MTEHRLYPDDAVPYVSTAEFHADRARAPHLEQEVHVGRLRRAAAFINDAALRRSAGHTSGEPIGHLRVSDLGCGDGGLLSLLDDFEAWGYDFQPSNQGGWRDRGVTASLRDVFGDAQRSGIEFGDVSVVTEVLEHLADPHAVVRWIGDHSRYLVASSPWNETPESHDACHAWAWDLDGYRALIEQGGYRVLRHETVGQFQVILGERPPRRTAVVCSSRQQFLDWCRDESHNPRDPSLILVTEFHHARGNWFDQVIEVGQRRPGLFADTRSRLRPDQQ